MTLLRILPGPLHRFVIFYIMRPLIGRHYSRKWAARLADSDRVVVGGGHLLSDVEYYFPIRIVTALGLVQPNTPLHFFAVGVAGNWSERGRRLLKNAIGRLNLGLVGARDDCSLANWRAQFHSPPGTICRDPALIAADIYDVSESIRVRLSKTPSEKRSVAIGVSDLDDLIMHANGGRLCGGSPDFFKGLAERLLAEGCRVTFFANGTAEDDRYLHVIRRYLLQSSVEDSDLAFEPRPLRPRDLVTFIARQDVLIAHRLHANIVAFSCLVPHVGLDWDPKLRSFFESVGRSRYCVTGMANPDEICRLAMQTLREGIDPQDHARVVAEMRASIDNLIARLGVNACLP
jgi:polysaccharide pyruvyl transferase WcaK-like protein